MKKQIIEKYMDQIWNKRDFTAVQELFSPSALIHSPLGKRSSQGEMAETIQQWTTAIPNLRVNLLRTVEEGNLVFSHWEARGTHEEELQGIPAQGNPIEYQGVSLYRFSGDKVVEYWAFLDSWTLEKQMRQGRSKE